ncbi:hypothetical protein [Sphingomonas sp.]|uniref:hypothetical protein n=1 Tax=Sphingomonas sp. TaxID=28214 RepID=UPI0025D6AF80|nr:hypothetical protein [Sphingomonas sp.]
MMTKSAKFALIVLVAAAPAMATDFTVTGTYSDGISRYLHIATGDLDGDGTNDDGVLRLACSGGAVSHAWIYAPREAGSGMATGKRQHGSVTFIKEWGAASPQIAAVKGGYDLKSGTKRGSPGTASWDLATNKGGRVGKTMAMDDWSEVTVTKLDAACSPGGGMPVVK